LRELLTPPLSRSLTIKHYSNSSVRVAMDLGEALESKRKENSNSSNDNNKDNDNKVEGTRDLIYLAGLEVVAEMALERRLGFLKVFFPPFS